MASDGCQWLYGYLGPCGCSGTPNSGGSWFLASESPRTLEETLSARIWMPSTMAPCLWRDSGIATGGVDSEIELSCQGEES